MAEMTLTLQVPAPLHDRLMVLADRTGQSMEATLHAALEEFADRWEDHLRACDSLEAGTEARVLLHVVNE